MRVSAGVGEMIGAVLILAGPLIAYSRYVNSIPVLDVRASQRLEYLAYSVILLMLVGISLGVFGLQRFLVVFRSGDAIGPSMLRVTSRMFDRKRYRRVMFAVTVIYGAVSAILSGMVVYRPLENFAVEYFVQIPSVIIAVCCGTPGFIPVLTVFFTIHLGLLLIPADILILVIVSALVGLNATLILCQYDNRRRSLSGRWLLGLGASCGLFTACPTCAGLLLSAFVLGLSPGVLLLLLGLQLFFVLGTMLALILGVALSVRVLAPQGRL